jgi:hypothetical protein
MSTDRQETFCRWWAYQLHTLDCDPSIWCMKYICDRMELNSEQRYWFCFLYANTYQLPTAWVLFNEFPDFHNADVELVARFSKEHASRLPYQKDQKWLRGNLGETFESYKDNIGTRGNQDDFFRSLTAAQGSDPDRKVCFTSLWRHVMEDFHKFGRYTAWFYLQALKEVCGLPLEPTSLMLSFDASATHRAGLCYAMGRDDWAAKGTAFDEKMLEQLEWGADEMLERVQAMPGLKGLPVAADRFSMETALCSFKKLFRTSQGRYIGFYLDRMAEDITKTSSMGWSGINWNLFWDARSELLSPEVNHKAVSKSNFDLFLTAGRFHPDAAFEQQLNNWYSLQ